MISDQAILEQTTKSGGMYMIGDHILTQKGDTSVLRNKCVALIRGCAPDAAKALAHARDFLGRRAIDVAVPPIQAALRARMLFLRRYELPGGALLPTEVTAPLHRSATCMVVAATDKAARAGLAAAAAAAATADASTGGEGKSTQKVHDEDVKRAENSLIVDVLDAANLPVMDSNGLLLPMRTVADPKVCNPHT